MNIILTEKPYHLCFETLASDLRVKIIDNLSKKSMSVSELSQAVNAERSNVSHSLKMLKDCSYVKAEKNGKEMIYSIIPGVMDGFSSHNEGLFKPIDKHMECFCNNDCKKLKN